MLQDDSNETVAKNLVTLHSAFASEVVTYYATLCYIQCADSLALTIAEGFHYSLVPKGVYYSAVQLLKKFNFWVGTEDCAESK